MSGAILVSFSGVDGSGKSTQINLLRERLERDNKKVVTVSLFNYFLLKPLISMGRARLKDGKSGPVRKNRNLILRLWFGLALIDFWVIYALRVGLLRRKYDVILADRYFHDLAISMTYYGYMPKVLLLSFVRLLPKADRQILLSVDPALAHKRSGEFSIDYFKEQARCYETIAKHFTKLDGSRDSGELSEQIHGLLR